MRPLGWVINIILCPYEKKKRHQRPVHTHIEKRQWEGGHQQDKGRPLEETKPADILILDFSVFRTARKQAFVCLTHPVCGMLSLVETGSHHIFTSEVKCICYSSDTSALLIFLSWRTIYQCPSLHQKLKNKRWFELDHFTHYVTCLMPTNTNSLL